MRTRNVRDEFDYPKLKDLSFGLIRSIFFLIVFVIGVVIGLLSSSNLDRYSIPNPRTSSSSFVKEDCLSIESFRFPKNVRHGMSDEELLWRASLVPQKAQYPFHRIDKVAFLFLIRGPLPFLPLWERFFEAQDVVKYSIYVHTNPGFDLLVSNSSVFYKRQIPSQVLI